MNSFRNMFAEVNETFNIIEILSKSVVQLLHSVTFNIRYKLVYQITAISGHQPIVSTNERNAALLAPVRLADSIDRSCRPHAPIASDISRFMLHGQYAPY